MKLTQFMLLLIVVFLIASGCAGPTPAKIKMDQEKYRIKLEHIPIVGAPAPGHCKKKESSDFSKKSEKKPFPWILYGEKDIAVVLVHGFIASPAEVIHLAHELNRAGATVYLPLIPGFGGDSHMANQTTVEKWKETLPEALEFMSECFTSVHLMGFSLGGALVSDFVLGPNVRDASFSGKVKIRSVTLLAPYYEPDLAMTGFAAWFMSIFTDTISLSKSFKLTGNPDLRIPIANPEYYNTAFPLKAVLAILKLGKELKSKSPAIHSKVPVFLGINRGDETVDNDASLKFVEKHFGGYQFDPISKAAKLPHQFMALGGHQRAEEMIGKIIKFIENN